MQKQDKILVIAQVSRFGMATEPPHWAVDAWLKELQAPAAKDE